MEFSKQDHKTLARLIDLGLQREYASGLSRLEALLQDWRASAPASSQDHFHRAYQLMREQDKHIARRYDPVTKRDRPLVLLQLVGEQILREEELEDLSEAGRKWILMALEEVQRANGVR
ncbi:MAG: hypothetical protein NW241_13290 [Bacteroidia bacterium]|nr:hypothetical protein [Bacteroidia bacterium]